MVAFLTFIHVAICIILIFVVLVQGGKGAELGAAFGGGSSQTLFGGRGAATFLGKMTTAFAVVFMLTSMLLAMTSFQVSTVVKQSTVPVGEQAPASPASTDGGAPEGQQMAFPESGKSAPGVPAVMPTAPAESTPAPAAPDQK